MTQVRTQSAGGLPGLVTGTMADVSQPANAAQARRWNGPDGLQWVAQRERHLAQHQHLTPHVLRAAGIAPGQRVLDVGYPPQITKLLSGVGWTDIEITPVTGPAWMGSDVDDVMGYVRRMQAVRNLIASLADEKAAEQVLAALAGQYAARQRPDGIWVDAAAWLITARRA
jgi:hypothetical protein